MVDQEQGVASVQEFCRAHHGSVVVDLVLADSTASSNCSEVAGATESRRVEVQCGEDKAGRGPASPRDAVPLM